MKKLRTIWPHITVLLILLLCSQIYYGEYIDRLPFGTHDWAQGDRLALAVNFYDNGLDFLHPATNSLYSDHGVVGVEAPVQAYLVAAIAKLTGRDSISIVFRLLDILLAITGLYFLFRAVWSATKDFATSLFAPLFVFCSPVYVFYSGNYLPDPAAANITFIALYYLLEAARGGRFRLLITSIAIATLAALIKASTIPYLAGILGYAFVDTLRRKQYRQTGLVIVAGVAGALLLVASFLRIQYLNEHYHSTLFLSSFRPFESWEEFWAFIENQYKNGLLHEYIMLAQYPVYALMIGAGAKALAKLRGYSTLGLPAAFFFVFAAIVFWLFSKQYEVHDYYFVPVFMPLVAYCLVVSLIAIWQVLRNSAPAMTGVWRTGLLSAAVITFFFADYQVAGRMRMVREYSMDYSFSWSIGGKELLGSLHIPDTERIAAANEAPPNLALIYFDRKGYNIPRDEHRDIRGIRRFLDEKNLRTVVMREDFLNDIQAKDNTALDSMFVVLARKDGKAVLRKK